MTFLRLAAFLAKLTGHYLMALHLQKEILMADFSAFDAAFAAAKAKIASDNTALAAANAALAALQAAGAGDQDKINAATAELTSLANGA